MHNDKKAYQVDRTPTELLSDLLVQLKFLRQECLHYDAGDWSYGAQIATKLRLLLHQTKYSDSLLAQITKRFAFSCPDFLSLSTVRGELPNKGRTDFVRSPLIQYQMIHQPEVPPVLTVQPLSLEPGKRYAKRAFKTWWDGIDILLIDRQHFLSRKGVVCLLANQEGGAHVQPGMDEKAAMLRRGAAIPCRLPPRCRTGRRGYIPPKSTRYWQPLCAPLRRRHCIHLSMQSCPAAKSPFLQMKKTEAGPGAAPRRR